MDDDMARYSDAKLAELTEDFHNYRRSNDDRTEAMEAKLDSLIENTAAIIQFQDDLVGTARLGIRVQKLGLWIIKWPVIGIGLYNIYDWALQHLPK